MRLGKQGKVFHAKGNSVKRHKGTNTEFLCQIVSKSVSEDYGLSC